MLAEETWSVNLRKYLTLETLIRIAADAVIVNAAYLAALIVRLLWRITTDPGISAREQLDQVVRIYATTALLLTVITLVVYGASGFYSRGRFYQSRFKALVILQAISLSYALFGSIMYLGTARGWFVDTPGLALAMGWVLTLFATEGARLWAVAWRLVVKRESRVSGKFERDDGIQHVLVVGGAGYIGSALCRRLLDQGYSVRVLDALLYGGESVSELLDHPCFELIEGDSRDVAAVVQAMLDMDMVVHLGELVGDPACAVDEDLTLEINLAATRMLAEVARGYGVKRFVYASSCSVYGASDEILDERSVLSPVSLYARAKVGCEKVLLSLNGPAFHPVILRCATVYGLSPRPRFDLVINLLTAKAVCDGEITIFGGQQWRPFIHVDDVARAIVCCLEAPLASVQGQVFNAGSDEQNYTIVQVGKLIQSLIPEARLTQCEEDTDKRNYRVSFSKIRCELSFIPQHALGDGIREIEAVLKAGQVADYRDKRYSNYKTLSESSNHLAIRSRHITGLYRPQALGDLVNGTVLDVLSDSESANS
jgi:nucleoside-diphosphate-sugar epimerase